MVFKRGFGFKYLIIKASNESHRVKIEMIMLHRKYSFSDWHKALVKTRNKIFHCFLFETSAFKASLKQITKGA